MIAVPIAIVGRGCVLPGALTPEALWAPLRAGLDLTSAAPAGRWGLDPDLVLAGLGCSTADRAISDRGGYVRGFESVWDASGYAVPAETLNALDPLVQWLVYAGRSALSGVRRGTDAAREGGVIGNLSFPTVALSQVAERVWLDRAAPGLADRLGRPERSPLNRWSSGLPAHLLAQSLGLGAGAFALDAACASSLYALRIACDRLASGRLDLALAGAVNRADDLFLHVGFTALQALSKSGRSLPLQADADGLLPAEGCVIFALKRLADAERDGDPIHGVIRGIGLANDGRAGGVLSPSSEGQERAVRAAWHRAGIEPTEVGFVECHATGTPVGDGVELDTLSRVFAGKKRLAIGSIKGNLGHPITAAGGAALLKLLGALEHGEVPPTVVTQRPSAGIAAGGFDLVASVRPWSGRPLAAVSAFGFGGNDAHLIVEKWEKPARSGQVAPPKVPVLPSVAVVAMAVRASDVRSAAQLRTAKGPPQALGPIRLVPSSLRIPPVDLAASLPQQLTVLEVAQEAVLQAGNMPWARTAVLVGMGVDAEVARWGARWRLAQWAREAGVSLDLAAVREAVAPVLTAAGVVGTMPNIPANRVQALFDAQGPGFTVSSEELSGLDALELAQDWLQVGEIDAAVVGAVELSREPVHAAAHAAAGRTEVLGDAAVVLVLRRLDDARAEGLRVLAVFSDEAPADLLVGGVGLDVTHAVGHAQAAVGLLHVAAAVAELAQVGGHADGAEVRLTTMSGREPVRLAAGDRGGLPAAPSSTPAPGEMSFASHLPEVVLDRFVSALVAPTILPLPPELAPVLPVATATSVPVSAPVPAAMPVAAPTMAPAPSQLPLPAVAAVSPPAAALPAWWVQQQAQVSAVHAAYMSRQQATHAAFLTLRAQSLAAFAQRARGLGSAMVMPVQAVPGVPRPGVITPSAPVAPVADTPRATRPEAAVVPPAIAPPAALPVASPQSPSVPKKPVPTGLTLDRKGLEVHAGGAISTIFGPLFAQQDGFARQVRMPEPPLLLADRVTGLVGERGVLGKGTVWTETDIRADSWYLHQGRMPGGVMIEAGQADLLLISWMGADFLNQSDRVYRLLGCTLTYTDRLPKVGDTITYDIHVDGHAKLGDIRMFFFHYDCVDQLGRTRLVVREGQAGFFTDEELDASEGILWTAETGEHLPDARVDAPALALAKRSFGPGEIEALARGDAFGCFGAGFERAQTHSDTPRIQPPPMLFFHDVEEVSAAGGPWGRGYLRASWNVSPDDWFFEGHFKNDPCMPGTLMFEGCLQALAFYLVSLGYTLPRDGWRFEPVPNNPMPMRCRGQVRPSAKRLTYEVFVEEVHDGPWPTVYADLLCTVDGLGAFHARRCGLRLVPAWPLDYRAESSLTDPPGAIVAADDGFAFGVRSMTACAWGRPSEAFGPRYARFDDGTRVPRLPGPPYLFVSRAEEVVGPMGGMKVGSKVSMAWEIPEDAWYFDANGAEVVPFAVLLEAVLQPCGWLASYVGCALSVQEELFFRNLDGTLAVSRELTRASRVMRTEVVLTNLSRSAGMIIVNFEVRSTDEVGEVCTMKTVFGFFPGAALAAQKGLPMPPVQQALLALPANVNLTIREDARLTTGSLRLADERLLMIDRLVSVVRAPREGVVAAVRAEKDISPAEWFFKAHFFQDPVQPGSLGIEALLQTLQAWMITEGLGAELVFPRFEATALGVPTTWKYRGQVLPHNKLVSSTIEVTRVERTEDGVLAVANGSLWVDGTRIYEAVDLAMRIVGTVPDGALLIPDDPDVLDPAVATWLLDHRPTWTLPAVPLASLVDRMVGAAERHTGRAVAEVEVAEVRRWVVVEGPVRFRARVSPEGDRAEVTLEASHDDGASYWNAARAVVRMGEAASSPAAWDALGGVEDDDAYAAGRLFHGPAFQGLARCVTTDRGASAVLDLDRVSVPPGALGQGLLDVATHAIPHDAIHRWNAAVPADVAAYPLRIEHLRRFAPWPVRGEVRVEARFDGMVDPRHVATRLQLSAHGVVVGELRLVEVLVPKGPIGTAPPLLRRRFLQDRVYVEGVGLGVRSAEGTEVRTEALAASDWLPGTVAAVYGTPKPTLLEVASRDHAAGALRVHPSQITVDHGEARTASRPLERVSLTAAPVPGGVRASGALSLDLSTLHAYWREWFGLGAWLMEDLDYALIERFVSSVVVQDPTAFFALKGRPVLFLANHQTAIESLLFSVIAGALLEVPTVTIAKAEHRGTWLGKFIQHGFSYPGARDPRVITYFDREDKEDLGRIISELAAEMAVGERSVMVHVEGTRAYTCREPVRKMSGAFLDMALAVGCPVIPVRFVGGLPVEPLPERTEFGVGLAPQAIYLGTPLMPEALAKLPYKERKQAVIDGINGLGPLNADEQPNAGQPGLQAEVDAWVAERGVIPEHAVVARTLLDSPRRGSAETTALVAALQTRTSPKGEDAVVTWMAELARRLGGA